MVSVRGRGRCGWVVGGMLAAVLAAGGPAAAQSSVGAGPSEKSAAVRSYLGPRHGVTPVATPTRFEGQSKLAFHDGAWWALMVDEAAGGMRLFELTVDHTWRPASPLLTTTVVEGGDVLLADGVLHVLTPMADGLQYSVAEYSATERTWSPSVPVPALPRTGSEATMAMDSAGRLWAAMASRGGLLVAVSSDGATWSEPFTPPVEGTDLAPSETAGIVAFAGSIGVLWSDQARGRWWFAVHPDAAEPTEGWTVETPLVGPGMADDHLSVKALDDTVVAVVKTSMQDMPGRPVDQPHVVALVRSDGRWRGGVVWTVAARTNAPTVLLSHTGEEMLVVAHAPSEGGNIYLKRGALADLVFETGRGNLLASGSAALSDPTSSKQPVDPATGLVVLLSGRDGSYRHAEMSLASGVQASEPDHEAPSAPSRPTALRQSDGSVHLLWEAVRDGDTWVPAADGRTAAAYEVIRDGDVLATVNVTRFVDDRAEAGAHEYAVVAMDAAGNRSGPSAPVTVVAESATGEVLPVPGWLAGLAAVVAVALVGGLVLRRSRYGYL